jgi:murein DD-endopeptidase MepM/ murein hydrolase activator NlpD
MEFKPNKIVIRPRGDQEYPEQTGKQSARPKPFVILTRPQTYLTVFLILLVCGILFGAGAYFFQVPANAEDAAGIKSTTQGSATDSELISGINLAQFVPENDVFREDITLTSYFTSQHLSEPVTRELIQQAENKGVDHFEKGHKIVKLTSKSSDRTQTIYLYYVSANKSMQFKLAPLPVVSIQLREVKNIVRAAGGIIKTSLWEAVLDYNIHYRLIEQMEEALKWSIDFYHVQPGDKFKVIYEEKRVGNEIVGLGQLKAVYFKTGNAEYYAYRINNIEKPGYYDENGKPVQRTFLKCPVKYERITSFYNPARIHPVTGELKAHLGTDFGAPEGSPIFSLADGVVEAAEFTSNNGFYVKIRHDRQYETQYLHMQHFEVGIRNGSVLKQGQIIGYVGQTGLATGPHVCLRFWKDGQQVDPRYEQTNLPFYMSLKDQEAFLAQKKAVEQQLSEIVYFDGKL